MIFVNNDVETLNKVNRRFWSCKKKFLPIIAVASILHVGCNNAVRNSTSETEEESVETEEEYHAENDIAMTVKSLVDAIRVGEKLDTTDYNFNGVLTDGIGRPLYSNVQGHPGLWDVDVLSPTVAVIRNEDIGDLLPDDLESYLVSNLGLDAANLIDSLEYHGPEGAETSVYDFGGGYIRLDVRTQAAASGLEGAMVRITASRDLPSPR